MRNHIKVFREEAGFTQTQIADRVGISVRALQYYEHTERTPDADIALKLAKALGTTVEKLFSESTPPTKAM